ncbi:hypothetical protein [Dactylosporangium sp. NPDC005555]|uniref:hypothetical protein n=1 Tax=Dactylosporangium sp. NPDC005555 TaxID=3154889 RepID=UPI0033A3FD44
MTDVKVLTGLAPSRRFRGSGFLLTPTTAITAHHVVRGFAADQVTVELPGGERLGAGSVETDAALDSARLALATNGAGFDVGVRAGMPAVGVEWVVTTQPIGNDAVLSGTVDAVGHRIVNAAGHAVTALQLRVAQHLGDFGGYSGSAVRLRSRPETVLGVLCEQVQARGRGGEARPATNVLYAVPLARILARFGVTVPGDLPGDPPGLDRVRQLLADGDPGGAETALARTAVTAAAHWYWRARIAFVRQNLESTSAYLDRGLALDPHHPAALALKIRVLLLSNEATARSAAADLANRSTGIDPGLDIWLACLAGHGMFGPGIRSDHELAVLCPDQT